MNLPNKITLTRIFMIPVFVALFYVDALPFHYVIAAAVFLLAALTDALDGYLARSRNLVTNLGKFLDPIADKVLVSTALIVLLTRPQAFAVVGEWGIAVAGILVALILARELIVSGFRMIAAGQNVVLAADKLGKIKTVTQDVAIVLLLVCMDLGAGTVGQVIAYVGLAVFALSAILTVVSGVNYVVRNRQVLTEKHSEKKEESQMKKEDLQMQDIALYVVAKEQSASVALVQRRCAIGYALADALVTEMEEKGYVSARTEGASREVYITVEKFVELFGENAVKEAETYLAEKASRIVMDDSELIPFELAEEDEEVEVEVFSESEEMLKRALRVAIDQGKVSISFLQRKLAIGYARAGRILDWMEESGYITPFTGEAKGCEVLITEEEYHKRFGEE